MHRQRYIAGFGRQAQRRAGVRDRPPGLCGTTFRTAQLLRPAGRLPDEPACGLEFSHIMCVVFSRSLYSQTGAQYHVA
jgi:hypothetical protein